MLNSPNSQISIHAPRVGSDVVETRKPKPTQKFLSTLPAWGATAIDKWGKNDFCNFYPRSPRGERHGPSRGINCEPADFYPRSPRGERQAASNHCNCC